MTRIHALIAASAAIATPALAQEVPATPQSEPAPAPTQQTPPPSRETGRPVATDTTSPSSPTTIRPEALGVRDEAIEAARGERRAAARPATRPATRAAQAAPAPRRAPPVERAASVAPPPVALAPLPAPAPPAEAPPATETVAEATPPAAAAPTAEAATTDATETESGVNWSLIGLVGLGVLALIAFLASRRRRVPEEEVFYDEPTTEYVEEPTPVAVAHAPLADPVHVHHTDAAEPVHVEHHAPVAPAAPVHEPEVASAREHVVAAGASAREHVVGAGSFGITAPVIRPKRPPMPPRAAAEPASVAPAMAQPEAPLSEEVSVGMAEAEDVASLTAATPVADRPWLEFAMRPVRAGTVDDEALVEIELTVANAGALPAEDVRISTFMLPASGGSGLERMLIDAPGGSAVEAPSIAPGEGTRIDATLAMRTSEIGVDGGFQPVVVADARYRLPGGGEGRTSASFVVGMANDGGELTPFALDHAGMHDDIEARLYGEPERA